MGEDAVMAERSTHESQELVVPSPSPTLSSPSHSVNPNGGPPQEPTAPISSPTAGSTPAGTLARDGATSPTGPVNAITVLTLLDKLVNMLDQVQENQHKMEVRQADMEGAVRGIQSDMTKLSKSHTSTSNTVSKLLEKSRKVSVHMKEVRDRMDKQATQVRRLEANHAHLLKRNNFKVLIFQEENEIPSSVFVKDPPPFPHDAEETLAVDANRSLEEGLQTINLSSDEELGNEEDDEEEEMVLELQGEHLGERSRAEKLKRSSLKKVDSLKKAFSRQNIEKKMNKIGTKIVSPEQREKIKKTLTAPHPKVSAPFKVAPLSFSIRKNRKSGTGGAETEVDPAAPGEVDDGITECDEPEVGASIELTPISPTENLPFTELHPQLAPEAVEIKAAAEAMEKEGVGMADGEGVSSEYALSATLPQDVSICNGTDEASKGDGYEEEEEEEKVGVAVGEKEGLTEQEAPSEEAADVGEMKAKAEAPEEKEKQSNEDGPSTADATLAEAEQKAS